MTRLVRPSILQVLEDYGLEQRHVGNSIFTFCLWHPDGNTPNLCIYPDTNSYYCFTCKVHGSVENLIAKLEHKTYSEVCKMLYGNNYEFRKLGDAPKPLEPDTNFMRESLSKELRESIQGKKIDLDSVPYLINKIITTKMSLNNYKFILEEIRNAK